MLKYFVPFITGLFIFLLLSYNSSHISDINPWLDMFDEYFLLVYGLPTEVSIDKQKFLILMKVNLSIFFMVTVFSILPKKPLLMTRT